MTQFLTNLRGQLIIALVVLTVIVSYPIAAILSTDRTPETATPALIAEAPGDDDGQGDVTPHEVGGSTNQGNSWGG